MPINGVSGITSYIGTGILNLRSELDSLTEQLSSGKISHTYAGDGSGRSLAIGIRAQLNSISSYADTATNVNTRIDVANLSLQRLSDIAGTVKGAAVSAGNTLDNTHQTPGQKTAYLGFFDSVDLLNAQSGDRYLFSGRTTDTPPVAPADQILNGNGANIAGLKQVIAERQTADLGTTGMGRVAVTAGATPTSVQIGEDFAADPTATPPVPASVFGMKISGVSTNMVGATTIQPTPTPVTTPPSPNAMTVDLNGLNPKDGDTFKFTFTMPDGTSEDVNLTASSQTPTPAGSFAIDPASPGNTLANFNAAVTTGVKALANGPLVAASAVAAGNNFFDEPPMRVNPSPSMGAATTLVAGVTTGPTANTVGWYTGEPDSPSDPARGTAVAQVDQGISVQYGIRADEQALRTQLQNVAVFAAVTTTTSVTADASAQVAALNQRIAQNLAVIPGTQTIQNIQADLAGAQSSIKSTGDGQNQTKVISQTLLDSIEGVNNDEVATKILALQTALQASYQTTSQLYQMSLVKFL
jgi:flagellar hook-associated protein 3 FlgL